MRILPPLLLLACLAVPVHAAEEYAEHVSALRESLPEGFFVMVEPPFVVIGDGGPERVAQRAESTVRWAARLLRKDFFKTEPTGPFDVWLLESEESYRARAKLVSGDPPDTPYGYFDPDARALVMNISTGGGTLVHEMVHVYVEADFPACPVWLNEGLGSLFEACRERLGHIMGLTNWRLPGIQSAIRADAVPTIEELTALTTSQFYGEGEGVHYSMARYLCYHLQEEGKLRGFYKAFRKAQAEDPAGYATLCATLGEDDMAAFQQRWEAWVLTLQWQR
jgi:hypothetical protein